MGFGYYMNSDIVKHAALLPCVDEVVAEFVVQAHRPVRCHSGVHQRAEAKGQVQEEGGCGHPSRHQPRGIDGYVVIRLVMVPYVDPASCISCTRFLSHKQAALRFQERTLRKIEL